MARSEIEILRLEAGDTDLEFPYLLDEDYQHAIDTIPSKRKRSKYIDMLILSVKANDTHERSGQEERWGNQIFENSLKLVEMKWKDPAFNGSQAVPIFGGTSREEMAQVAMDADVVNNQFYLGQNHDLAQWQEAMIFTPCGNHVRQPHCYVWRNRGF